MLLEKNHTNKTLSDKSNKVRTTLLLMASGDLKLHKDRTETKINSRNIREAEKDFSAQNEQVINLKSVVTCSESLCGVFKAQSSVTEQNHGHSVRKKVTSSFSTAESGNVSISTSGIPISHSSGLFDSIFRSQQKNNKCSTFKYSSSSVSSSDLSNNSFSLTKSIKLVKPVQPTLQRKTSLSKKKLEFFSSKNFIKNEGSFNFNFNKNQIFKETQNSLISPVSTTKTPSFSQSNKEVPIRTMRTNILNKLNQTIDEKIEYINTDNGFELSEATRKRSQRGFNILQKLAKQLIIKGKKRRSRFIDLKEIQNIQVIETIDQSQGSCLVDYESECNTLENDEKENFEKFLLLREGFTQEVKAKENNQNKLEPISYRSNDRKASLKNPNLEMNKYYMNLVNCEKEKKLIRKNSLSVKSQNKKISFMNSYFSNAEKQMEVLLELQNKVLRENKSLENEMTDLKISYLGNNSPTSSYSDYDLFDMV
jgi:hypothetical protein